MSSGISYTVEVYGDATDDDLHEIVRVVDRIAEIPNSLRGGTAVRLTGITVTGNG